MSGLGRLRHGFHGLQNLGDLKMKRVIVAVVLALSIVSVGVGCGGGAPTAASKKM